MGKKDIRAMVDCENLIDSGYYPDCRCGRNGDHEELWDLLDRMDEAELDDE